MPRPRPHFVVIDTETTGLDPRADRIIDIGAVRLDQDLRVTATFTTLVDPGVPIPLFITRLTGISDADVAGAPCAAEALAGLRAFAGDATLVGHNAAFDREHLAAAARCAGAAPLAGDWFDTLDAALLLYPELDRHALPILVEELGLDWPAHRALPDAQATAAVLARLARRAAGLAEVERRLLESVSWAPLSVLDACAAAPDEAPPPLVADEPPEGPGPLAVLPVDPDGWRAELDGDGGAEPGLAARLPGFRRRAGQVDVRGGRRRRLRGRRHRVVRGRHRHGQEPRVPAAGGLRRRGRRPPRPGQHQDQGPPAAAGAHGAAARGGGAAPGLALGAADGPGELPLPAAPRRGGGRRG